MTAYVGTAVSVTGATIPAQSSLVAQRKHTFGASPRATTTTTPTTTTTTTNAISVVARVLRTIAAASISVLWGVLFLVQVLVLP